MAWALTLAGSAKSLSVDTPFYLPTNCDLEINMAWNAISSSYEMIFGTWATGASDEQFYFGKYNAPNGTYTLYKRGGAVRSNSSVGEIVVDTYAVLTLERRGDNLRVLKDDVEICASITFPSGVLDNALIKTFCAGNESGFNANVSVKSVTLKNIDTATTTNLWDATASDHNNSSGQTRLTDTVGANDATGVNMDASAWIDLGGNETNVEQEVSVISTEQLTESQLVTISELSNINTIVTESLSQSLLSNIIIDNKAVLAITEQLEQCIAIDVSNDQLVSFVQSQQQNEAIIVNVTTSGAQDINVIVTQQETHTQAFKTEALQPLKTVTTEQIAQVISLAIDQLLPINVVATEQISQAVSIIVNESSGALIFVVESEQLTQLIDVDIDVNESINAVVSEQLTQHSARRIHVDLLISTTASEQFTQSEIINVLQRNITTQQSINFDNIFLESLTPVYTLESLTPIYIIERTH